MDDVTKRKQSFLLRLPVSVREQAIRLAIEEGTSLNFFISMAVAEKITQLETRRTISRREVSIRIPEEYGSSQHPQKPIYG